MSQKTIDGLLGAIRSYNEKGIAPSKWQVVSHKCNYSRSRDYSLINELIKQGLVINAGTRAKYELIVVD